LDFSFLVKQFAPNGRSIHASWSGQKGAVHQPDLAILDMQMEKRASGLEVVQRMRASTSLSGIPVIIYICGCSLLGEVRDRLVAHQCQILEKPFNLNVLLDLVGRTIVQKEHKLGASAE
jgi:CheY-like chemotaxis protein